MKNLSLLLAVLALTNTPGSFVATAATQSIPNISTGVDGAFDPPVTTSVALPVDGRLNYTTVRIRSGVTVNFIPNASNTPVYLLAQGDINIDGSINVNGGDGTALMSGRPGPGGFAGGAPGSNGSLPGDGLGPGAGAGGTTGGNGAFGTVPTPIGAPNQRTYGSPLLIPLVGGSGGGGSPFQGGGGGGGAILIASSTRIEHIGSILAQGGSGGQGAGYGSGGAVRLLAPVIGGRGTITVSGAHLNPAFGHGRVSCEMLIRTNFRPTLSSSGSHINTSNYLPFVLPPNLPTLRVVSVGGVVIPPDAPANYTVTLPLNASPSQPIVVEAAGFGMLVDVEIQVTPLNGPALPRVSGQIDNISANPATRPITVTLPANTPLSVSAWTR